MKKIHNDGNNSERKPLVLTLNLSHQWLQQELTENKYRKILDFEMPSEELLYKNSLHYS